MDMNLGKPLEDSEGQTCLACCSGWGHKELDRTSQLNNDNIFLRVETQEKKPSSFMLPFMTHASQILLQVFVSTLSN